MTANRETAVGATVPVIGDGEEFAEVTPIWSDVDGVRVSMTWAGEVCEGTLRIEYMSTV